MLTKWGRRIVCHGSIICCQYVDSPQCNSGYRDPHWLGRWYWNKYVADRDS